MFYEDDLKSMIFNKLKSINHGDFENLCGDLLRDMLPDADINGFNSNVVHGVDGYISNNPSSLGKIPSGDIVAEVSTEKNYESKLKKIHKSIDKKDISKSGRFLLFFSSRSINPDKMMGMTEDSNGWSGVIVVDGWEIARWVVEFLNVKALNKYFSIHKDGIVYPEKYWDDFIKNLSIEPLIEWWGYHRNKEQLKLNEYCDGDGQFLTIYSFSVDESVLFACSVLHKTNFEIVIIKDDCELSSVNFPALCKKTGIILIFKGRDAYRKFNVNNDIISRHRVIICDDFKSQAISNHKSEFIRLESMSQDRMREMIKEKTPDDDDPSIIAKDVGGSLSLLMWRYSAETPEFKFDLSWQVAYLIGSWDRNNNNDRCFIEKICRKSYKSYDEFENSLREDQAYYKNMIEEKKIFDSTIINVRDNYNYKRSLLYRDFRSQEINKIINLAKFVISDKERKYSNYMASAIIESMGLFSSFDKYSKYSDNVEKCINDALGALDDMGGDKWRFLNNHILLLFEASPSLLVDKIVDDISHNFVIGDHHELSQLKSSLMVMMCQNNEYSNKILNCLRKLVVNKQTNNPFYPCAIETISMIFARLPIIVYSYIPNKWFVNTMDEMIDKCPDDLWNIYMRIHHGNFIPFFPHINGRIFSFSGSNNHTHNIEDAGKDAGKIKELNESCAKLLKFGIGYMKKNPSEMKKWMEDVSILFSYGGEILGEISDIIMELWNICDADSRDNIKGTVRRWLKIALKEKRKDVSDCMSCLLQKLKSDDLVIDNKWLFTSHHPDIFLDNDWNNWEALLLAKRSGVIEWVMNQKGMDGVFDICGTAVDPFSVGQALADGLNIGDVGAVIDLIDKYKTRNNDFIFLSHLTMGMLYYIEFDNKNNHIKIFDFIIKNEYDDDVALIWSLVSLYYQEMETVIDEYFPSIKCKYWQHVNGIRQDVESADSFFDGLLKQNRFIRGIELYDSKYTQDNVVLYKLLKGFFENNNQSRLGDYAEYLIDKSFRTLHSAIDNAYYDDILKLEEKYIKIGHSYPREIPFTIASIFSDGAKFAKFIKNKDMGFYRELRNFKIDKNKLPGIDEDGSVNEDLLNKWIDDVLDGMELELKNNDEEKILYLRLGLCHIFSLYYSDDDILCLEELPAFSVFAKLLNRCVLNKGYLMCDFSNALRYRKKGVRLAHYYNPKDIEDIERYEKIANKLKNKGFDDIANKYSELANELLGHNHE